MAKKRSARKPSAKGAKLGRERHVNSIFTAPIGGPGGPPLVNLDAVDFGAILDLMKPLLETAEIAAGELPGWEAGGPLGECGAALILRLGEQRRPLLPILAAAGLARRGTAVWIGNDPRRRDAALAIQGVFCDWLEGKICPGELLAKRLGAAVKLLEAAASNEVERIIVSYGNRSYSIEGKSPIVVTNEEHHILAAFAVSKVALDTKKLKGCATNPAKIIANLERKFPGAVHRPKCKGDGYYIAVKMR